MSGSTRVGRHGDRIRLHLETPCISFATNPDGSSPEQSFHAEAHARFEAVLDAVWPGFEAEVLGAAEALGLELVAVDDRLPIFPYGPKTGAVQVLLPTYRIGEDGAVLGLEDFGQVTLGIAQPPRQEQVERLRDRVVALLDARRPST